MHEKRIKGVVPALVTPFDKESNLNVKAIPQVLKPLLDAGCTGLFVCGATGEATTLTLDERKQMATATIGEIAESIPVIIHVGATHVDDAVTLAKHAKEAGATAIGSLPPLSRGSIDKDIEYYSKVGSAGDLPFYVYWRADMAQGNITPEQFLEKMTSVPNFNGIKFTDPNFYFLQRLGQLNGALNLLTGPDELFIAGLAMGSHGAIGTTYNFMPKHYLKMYKDFLDGRINDAMEMQANANELIALLIQFGVISGTKAILEARGIPAGPARSDNTLTPYKEVGPQELNQMQRVIEQYDLY